MDKYQVGYLATRGQLEIDIIRRLNDGERFVVVLPEPLDKESRITMTDLGYVLAGWIMLGDGLKMHFHDFEKVLGSAMSLHQSRPSTERGKDKMPYQQLVDWFGYHDLHFGEQCMGVVERQGRTDLQKTVVLNTVKTICQQNVSSTQLEKDGLTVTLIDGRYSASLMLYQHDAMALLGAPIEKVTKCVKSMILYNRLIINRLHLEFERLYQTRLYQDQAAKFPSDSLIMQLLEG